MKPVSASPLPQSFWPISPRHLYAMLIPAILLLAGFAALAAAIAWGGPRDIAALDSVNTPFAGVDFSQLPPVQRYTARDGTALAWYGYAPVAAAGAEPLRRVVLIHGSSSRARSTHVLAQALAASGYAVAALDMRGHGESGPRGQAAYVGQMDDDLEDFLRAVPHAGPQTLMGFSAGGGFALRIAGGPLQGLFDRYVLLAPFLHQNAPTARPDTGGWAAVGVPRLMALTLLNQLGIAWWNHLPVLGFALDEASRAGLTPHYSYTVASNFRPRGDYLSDIRNARGHICIVAGQEDELFHAERYAGLFAQAGKSVSVTLVPGVNHIGLTLNALAVRTIAHACQG
ncbi:alpha/beta hydrolase [Acidovorax sp. sif1233]|uniref:alpha/beta hydrolase n=1 Tax=Acidovorax sp. sif1233 TaxID=2854792 RepID=UPI0021035ECB|nr:alpha/beta fold hydrolase [Acidovorax sp. sif1233]